MPCRPLGGPSFILLLYKPVVNFTSVLNDEAKEALGASCATGNNPPDGQAIFRELRGSRHLRVPGRRTG